MPRKKHPREWFKLYANTRHVFASLSDEAAGQALKLALVYFALGEEPPDTVSPMVAIGFNVLRNAADEAISDYAAAVENGRKGAAIRDARQAAQVEEDDDPW